MVRADDGGDFIPFTGEKPSDTLDRYVYIYIYCMYEYVYVHVYVYVHAYVYAYVCVYVYRRKVVCV